jgi:hypothetical protein
MTTNDDVKIDCSLLFLDALNTNEEQKGKIDTPSISEDVTGLIIELISILFAILGTFILFRYVKTKYSSVPTTEPPAAK